MKVRTRDETDPECDALAYQLCTVGAERREILRWFGQQPLGAEVLFNCAPIQQMPNGRCWADAEAMHCYLSKWIGLNEDIAACVRALERTMARLALEKL